MWERFTERAKDVVTGAREEAMRLGSEYVHTEHVLLGLCREPEGIAGRALENSGIDIESLVMEIELQVERGDVVVSGEEIAFTPRAKKVLELAVEEARRLNDSYIGTEHILLGLMKEGNGMAAKILKDMKANYKRVQAEVNRLLGDEEVAPALRIPAKLPSFGDRGETPIISIPTRQASTKPSRKLIKAAREEATKRGDKYVWPQHILYALCADPDSTAARVLTALNADLTTLAATTHDPIPRLDEPPPKHMGENSPQAHKIMEIAVEEAFESDRGYLGTEHVLLALIRLTDANTVETLKSMGVDYESTKAAIKRLLDDNSLPDDEDQL